MCCIDDKILPSVKTKERIDLIIVKGANRTDADIHRMSGQIKVLADMPGIDEEEGLIAPAGARGVVVHFGHSEVDPSREIYLVRFETGADGSLGNPVGCLPDELTQDPPPSH